MRIALILLSIVALMFIGSISWSLIQSSGTWIQPKSNSESTSNGTDIETLKYQIKTEEKLKELDSVVQELAKKNGITSSKISTEENTGSKNQKEVKLSGKFLAQVMPTATLTLIQNNGIFGLYTFDTNTEYSTYEDEKMGMKAIASSMSYDTFLKNAKALGKDVYTLNETKNFPMRSFYLNPPKTDTIVRLVLEYESQSVAIEISKTKFPTLKSLLLKK